MKISHKADYALSAVSYMSRQPQDKRNSINAIAESEAVPRDFLAKILKDLTTAGLLRSYQGVHGGYQLAKSPAQISVLDVIEAIDGPLGLNLCVRGEHNCERKDAGHCGMFPFWEKTQKQIRTLLKNETFGKARAGARK
jgi:Rrf2 family protein